MRTVQYRNQLDQVTYLRVQFELDNGRVQKFTVQLECLIVKQWTPVVRYDTANGFAHMDILHPFNPAQKMQVNVRDYNDALTLAMDDLTKNHIMYRRRYQQWLRNR